MKTDFDMDFEASTATCPNGMTATNYTLPPSLNGGKRFRWLPQQCGGCSLATLCLSPNRRTRTLNLHPFEQLQRSSRERWDRPEVRARYRVRAQCERLINRMTRHGGRQARAWGLAGAHFQAHAIAITSNLALLAKAMAEEDALPMAA